MLTAPKSGSSPREPEPEPEQNPDSSSKIDVTEVEDGKCVDGEKKEKSAVAKEEGVNLTVYKGKKAAVTLVKQKDEVSSSECKGSRAPSNRQSDVWRPY